jgi:hypothetical protein
MSFSMSSPEEGRSHPQNGDMKGQEKRMKTMNNFLMRSPNILLAQHSGYICTEGPSCPFSSWR